MPRYQKQGVGLALFKVCIAELDPIHLDCGVCSSVAGRHLYEKAEWKAVGEKTTDFSEFGGGNIFNHFMGIEAMKAAKGD